MVDGRDHLRQWRAPLSASGNDGDEAVGCTAVEVMTASTNGARDMRRCTSARGSRFDVDMKAAREYGATPPGGGRDPEVAP